MQLNCSGMSLIITEMREKEFLVDAPKSESRRLASEKIITLDCPEEEVEGDTHFTIPETLSKWGREGDSRVALLNASIRSLRLPRFG